MSGALSRKPAVRSVADYPGLTDVWHGQRGRPAALQYAAVCPGVGQAAGSMAPCGAAGGRSCCRGSWQECGRQCPRAQVHVLRPSAEFKAQLTACWPWRTSPCGSCIGLCVGAVALGPGELAAQCGLTRAQSIGRADGVSSGEAGGAFPAALCAAAAAAGEMQHGGQCAGSLFAGAVRRAVKGG